MSSDRKEMPCGHIATNPGEIEAHGRHADLVAEASWGSHQVRIDERGNVIHPDNLNFNKRFGWLDDFDNDRFGNRVGFGLDADPRCTGMGGYAPRR